ncbi:hypothetical protein [Lactiplantibacillus modestisalitolerans]|uniref:Integral membrane protein n=1 Tax=Lactiplantibacillus modestisalitolerans TaxID=1457219 RepID=A0ABV5WUM3_9LACO|nr:hypothetical protein [Lactiplantibacillus modestisalitolerans]
MTNKRFFWTLSNCFALLLFIIGSLLALGGLWLSFGSSISVDAVIAAAVLWIAAVIFLHPAPVFLLVPVIIAVSLGAGYASYYSSPHSWLGALIAVILTGAITSYGLSIRKAIRRRHSNWFH